MNAFSLWNFKPGETKEFPSFFAYANTRFLNTFAVLTPTDIEVDLDALPDVKAVWERIPSWIVRTDLARLVHVYLHGGFYFDSDCEILRRPPPTSSLVLVQEALLPSTASLGPRECKDACRRQRIANYAFGSATARNPFFRACLDECLRRLEEIEYTPQSPEDVLWVCGPDVLTSVYHLTCPQAAVLDRHFVKHHAAGSWRVTKQ